MLISLLPSSSHLPVADLADLARGGVQISCLLEMGEALEQLLPALVQALTGSSTRALWEALQALSQTLQTEARTAFSEFESSLGKDASKPPGRNFKCPGHYAAINHTVKY